MKYTIEFKGTRGEREAQALKATKEYLGTARYLQIRRKLVDWCLAQREVSNVNSRELYRGIQFALVLIGVQGRWPARAVIRDTFTVLRNCRPA